MVIEPATGKFSVAIVKDGGGRGRGSRTQMTLEEAQLVKKTRPGGHPDRDSPQAQGVRPDRGPDGQSTSSVRRCGRAERSQMYAEMQSRAHEIVTAQVMKVDEARGLVVWIWARTRRCCPATSRCPARCCTRGSGSRSMWWMSRSPTRAQDHDQPHPSRPCQADVRDGGARDLRRHRRDQGDSPGRRGMRTKMAVWSKDPNVDPVGRLHRRAGRA